MTPTAPPPATDVADLPITDHHLPLPNIRTRTCFVVKARLDEDAMKNALDTLIREHWRRLGARLHLNTATGLYQYHTPQTFQPGYELFTWSTATKAGSINAAAPKLMNKPLPEDCEGESGVAFLPCTTAYDAEFHPSWWPYEYSDTPADMPMMYFHLTFYDDATVIAINVPHLISDQLGLVSMVRGWMGVLDGKTPPSLMEDDPLPASLKWSEMSNEDKHGQKGQLHVRGFGEYFFVAITFVPEMIRQTEKDYTIFLPMTLVKSVRGRIEEELEANGNKSTISDQDVLTAIMTKFAHIEKRPAMISLYQTTNFRGRVPKLMGPEVAGFLSNATARSSTRFLLSRETPLHEIARLNREALIASLEPGALEKHLAVIREMVHRKQTMHVCEKGERSYCTVSWTAAWRDLDFSPAVVGYKDSEKLQQKAQSAPEYFVTGRGDEKTTPHRYHCTIMFRNEKGYWIDFSGTPKNIAAIKAHLAADPNLEKL